MNSKKPPVVSEEPLPGWQRLEVEGEKPWFKTPIPRTVISSAAKLQDFLEKEHDVGRMLEIDGREFSFKRKLGLRKKSTSQSCDLSESDVVLDAVGAEFVDVDPNAQSESVVERLTRSGEIVDHRKLLSKSSRAIDDFRNGDGFRTPETFEELKQKVASSSDLKEMLAILHKETPVTDALNLMFSDTCLAEISHVDTTKGPMVEFPASINENVYCKTAEFGMKMCPSLMLFVIV